ncbi:MAG: DUF599 domain-containing protein [Thermoplasmatota archaeon]
MLAIELVNNIALIIFIICISIYGVGLLYKMKRPSWGERGFLNIMYGLWVKRMTDPKDTIVAVQTMRNLIMITTFLPSAMILLLGLLLSAPASNDLNGLLSFSLPSNELYLHYKLLLFVAIIVFSVIMFLLSLRQMVRFSVLIGIPAELIETISANQRKTASKKKIFGYLNAEELKKDVFLRAMNRFTFGMRAIFYGITIILWFLSVYVFIIGTICLTIYLIVHHDVEPPHNGELPI